MNGPERASSSGWSIGGHSRENERLYFSLHNRDEDASLEPVLKIFREEFQASVVPFFSPYNSPYEIAVREILIVLVDDNWPCPYFYAKDHKDEQVLRALADDLQAKLQRGNVESKPLNIE